MNLATNKHKYGAKRQDTNLLLWFNVKLRIFPVFFYLNFPWVVSPLSSISHRAQNLHAEMMKMWYKYAYKRIIIKDNSWNSSGSLIVSTAFLSETKMPYWNKPRLTTSKQQPLKFEISKSVLEQIQKNVLLELELCKKYMKDAAL